MTTVNILLRVPAPALDAHGNFIYGPDGDDVLIQPARYEDVDLDTLTPRARALAEAIAGNPLRTRSDILLESDQPIRKRVRDWQHWYTEAEADQPDRRPWRGWAHYPSTSTVTPARYLETEAAKIPPGWHVLGHHPRTPVPTTPEQQQAEMTSQQVLAYLSARGRRIEAGTWRSYVARGEAPAPARKIGRTPLWARPDIIAYAEGAWRHGPAESPAG